MRGVHLSTAIYQAIDLHIIEYFNFVHRRKVCTPPFARACLSVRRHNAIGDEVNAKQMSLAHCGAEEKSDGIPRILTADAYGSALHFARLLALSQSSRVTSSY